MTNLNILYRMTRRNILIYLKDKANIFFSMMSPLIILGIYILFVGKLQIDGLNDSLTSMGISAEEEVQAFCDSWMLTGVMAVTCITVALCSCCVMVQDRQRGIIADVASSPVAKWIGSAAYYIAIALVTAAISLIVLGLCFVYLAISETFFLSVADVFGCIGVTLLSVLSSTVVMGLIASFIKTEGGFSGLNIVVGTAIGFLIGAFMPISTFPKAIQYFTLFIPGSYSAGLFRQFFMGGALDKLARAVPKEMADELAKSYSLTYDFFGTEIKGPAMAVILAGSVVLFLGINLLINRLRNDKRKG